MVSDAVLKAALALAEQVGVGSGALEGDHVLSNVIDQEPVTADVAVAMTLPCSAQLVIAMTFGQALT